MFVPREQNFEPFKLLPPATQHSSENTPNPPFRVNTAHEALSGQRFHKPPF